MAQNVTPSKKPKKESPSDIAFGAVTDGVEMLREEFGLSFKDAKKAIKKAAKEVNECPCPKDKPCPDEE